jgi:hypothetical protein
MTARAVAAAAAPPRQRRRRPLTPVSERPPTSPGFHAPQPPPLDRRSRPSRPCRPPLPLRPTGHPGRAPSPVPPCGGRGQSASSASPTCAHPSARPVGPCGPAHLLERKYPFPSRFEATPDQQAAIGPRMAAELTTSRLFGAPPPHSISGLRGSLLVKVTGTEVP